VGGAEGVQYLVLFLAVLLLGTALVVGFRPRRAGITAPDASQPILGLSEPEPVLPPVLLPERPTAADVDALRLSPALRGYRCEEVDAVLDVLGAELDRLRAENTALVAAPGPVVSPEGEGDSVPSGNPTAV